MKSKESYKSVKKEIKDAVDIILKFTALEEFKTLKQTNYEQYNKEMINMFPEFNNDFPALFDIVIKGDDLTLLYVMLNKYENSEKNNLTYDQIEEQVQKSFFDSVDSYYKSTS